ncbi:cytochrome b561 domain-containing protein At4g18260-like [Lotus japonicus]|uniref:cytochrome b561 domain-containing protein At4g18260-like n=1 Tax=Lotus japonicus TaxID=34305 RepID=UPI0025870D69|nr:cytochrome b561 domain-containing protein At4g18260-like [Lotus japonicus]
MGFQQKLFQASLVITMFLIVSASQQHKKAKGIHSRNKDHHTKINPRLHFEITLHGFLLWASLAFLMPVGVLVIRLSSGDGNRRRLRIIFYAHAVLQKLAVLLATVGAIMSIKNFNLSFNNNHQRVGVALYGIIWLQVLVGIFRPQRGSKRRRLWFFAHWIIGTAVSIMSVLNIYSGLQAYHEKTSKSIRTWKILFTFQISLIVMFYLLQEKLVYIQNQGVTLGNKLLPSTCEEISLDDKEKALKNEG